jgi:hypothetical protein
MKERTLTPLIVTRENTVIMMTEEMHTLLIITMTEKILMREETTEEMTEKMHILLLIISKIMFIKI